MKASYVEGLATHVDPESCVRIREGAGEALPEPYLSWCRMYHLIANWRPHPHICHQYSNQRLIATTQGRSRMR